MNNVDDALNAALSISRTPKEAQVAEASMLKQLDFQSIAAARATGDGNLGVGSFQWDLQNLSPGQIQQKYGYQVADQVDRGLAGVTQQRLADAQVIADRGAGATAWDTTSGALSGFVGSLANLAATGVGLIDANAGTQAAKDIQAGQQWVQSLQSDAVNLARQRQELDASLARRDNEVEMIREDNAGADPLLSGLKRWGKDVIDSVDSTISDPTTLGQGTAEALGSFVAGGPIAKGLRGLGLLATAGARGAGLGFGATRTALRAVDNLAWPAATAAMEGSGAYTGSVNDVMEMTPAQLEASSPTYRALIADGLSPEEARIRVANRSGLLSAAIQAPIAGAVGTLTRFAENPLHVPSLGSAVRNVLVNEPLEEAIQSTTGQVSQNIAARTFADENLNLSEDVGQQTAQGAIYGMTSAGVAQAPGAAVKLPAAAGRAALQGTKAAVNLAVAAGKPLFNAWAAQGERNLEAANKASPIADDVISTTNQDLVANAPVDTSTIQEGIDTSPATPEQKTQAKEFMQKLVDNLTIDLSDPEIPEQYRGILGNSIYRADAIQNMAKEVANTSGIDQLNAAGMMWVMMQPMRELQSSDPEALSQVDANHPARELLDKYTQLVANIDNTPSVRKALEIIDGMFSGNQAQEQIQPVTEESLATPEGQQNVRNAVAVASLHPDKGNLAANESILTHASNGKLNLSTSQLNTLRASTELLRARQKMEAEIKAKGLRSAKDVVSEQIVAGNDPLRKIAKSALQHTQGILAAKSGNNDEYAAFLLEDFGKFVQHMKNKVSANLEHYAMGDPRAPRIPFMQLQPDEARSFQQTTDRHSEYLNTLSEKSVDHSQTINMEANILADVYNGLVNTFPELNQQPIEMPAYPQELNAPAADVVAAARAGTLYPAQTKVQAQSETTPQPQAEPVEVKTASEVQETPVQPEAVPQATSRISPTDVRRLTDAGLNDRLNRLMDKRDRTPEDEATLAALNEEMTRREDAAAAEQQAQEQQEEVPVEVNPETTTEVVVNEQAVDDDQNKPATMGSAFPNVVRPETNRFLKAFKIPSETISRLFGQVNPTQIIQRALSSNMRLRSFLSGSQPRNTLTQETAEAYGELLSLDTKGNTLGHLLSNVVLNLDTFLNKPRSKKDPTSIGDLYRAGTEANRWKNGKVLNIVEDVDGELRYNIPLLEQAGLATMQWLLTSGQIQSQMDESDIGDLVGIDPMLVNPAMVRRLSRGMSSEQAVRSLAQKIVSFWGITPNNEQDDSYVEGIPQSMAAEMIRGLRDMGLLSVETTQVSKDSIHYTETLEDGSENEVTLLTAGEVGFEPKTLQRYVTTEIPEDHPLNAFPDAIEVATLVNPEYVNFFGDERPTVPTTQLNNPGVPNTQAQMDAIEKEQKTPFYINQMMVDFYNAMTKDNLLGIFGTRIANESLYNVNHLESIKGQNTNIVSAFDQLTSTMMQLTNYASNTGQAVSDVGVYFGYNMSRAGRMQMQGKYNPQSSKLMREALLPTRTTLDLSNQNGEHWDAYTLAMAQHLGIKIHNQSVETSQMQLDAMLNGGLAPVVQMLQEWMQNSNAPFSSEQVALLAPGFKAAGADLTFGSLHAVVDWARLQNTTDKSKFTTSLYLEADGVTNGPINAMALMSIGNFTPDWLMGVRRGGLSFGAQQSLAQLKSNGQDNDSRDLYQASTDATRKRLVSLRQMLEQQSQNSEAATAQMDQLLNLMDLFNKNITFDPGKAWSEGGLEMLRGIAKNPLTITIYGSGARGIAGKLVAELTGEIYARMSNVIQARELNENVSVADAMFPNDPNAIQKMERFVTAYMQLTTQKPVWNRGNLVLERTGLEPTADKNMTPQERFQKFTFSKPALDTLQENMLQLFVEPMRQGIEDTVGEPLMKAVGVLRDAMQVQSVIMQYEFMKAIDDALTEKERNDPNWKRGDFLSRADRNKIMKRLRAISPLVSTGEQNFLIASSNRIEVRGNDLVIGAALDDSIETGPSVYAPGEAGVRAIPLLTIGMGDGMMMQLLAQMGLEGTLKIFDGMNMPLDKIKEYSALSNEAVYESWKGNPLREALNTFNTFLNNLDVDSINDTTRPALLRTLFSSKEVNDAKKSGNPITSADIHARMEVLLGNLDWSAQSIDARHRAMQSMPMSVDQMAAAASPYHNGRAVTDGMTQEEILRELNTRYLKIMEGKEVTSEVTVAPVVPVAPAQPTPEIEKVGRVSASGARVLSWTALTKLGKSMTEAQKVIFDEIRRSLVARDYKILSGSVEQLDAYIEQKGLSPRPDQEVFGWTNIADKTIFLVNPSMETLVHELVHAASYETVLAYYNGEDLGSNSVEVKNSIARLEAMMQDFLSMEEEGMDPALRSAYDSARQAILSANLESDQAVSQAKALNEFMAWAMTNEQLTKTLKQKSAHPLVQLAKNVIKAIKSLIWGKKVAPKVADDFLSNLQFNSGIVIRSQPSIADIARDGELFHSDSYGNSDRLSMIRETFGKQLLERLNDEVLDPKQKLREQEVHEEALTLASEIARVISAHGFPMNMQETATFEMIVAALATEASIDPNSLARAQELYTHVSKNLTVEHFMDDPESDDPSARYYAQEKYDALMGKYLTATDAKGRSSLLPAFLGLAVVSDEFREILAKIAVPQKDKNKDGSLDALLENTANSVMQSLSRRLSGDVQSTNVRAAIDNLMVRIHDTANREQTYLDQYSSKVGNIFDRANDYFTTGAEKLSDIVMEKADDVEKNAKNKMTQLAARTTKLLASVVSEKNGAVVAEQTMTMLNKSNLWEPLHTLMNDLVGRTQSNKLIYDMIKVTRSMVQQVRQQFREETPRIIMSKFKAKLTDAQWATTFRAMGKTDLAVLRNSMSHAEIQELFTKQANLDSSIEVLEKSMQNLPHWNLIQEKAKQLANYMNTGVPGASLLKNAYAIAHLFGQPVIRGYKAPGEDVIQQIDKLVTLYALNGLSQADRTSMASLVQSEADGLSFMLDYMVGQRKEEVAKASSLKSRINAYKGFIPSEPKQGVSLIVADDAKAAYLKNRGFVRKGNYIGSSAVPRTRQRGYYYAPLSGRAIFNQGIMQNVRHTAGGVDSTTGYTVGPIAGRITDMYAIRRAAKYLRADGQINPAEALMPVWNEYGQIIALEEPMSAVQMKAAEPSEHLPKMIGIWRGRQAEEGMSQIFNNKLIDNLKAMYDEDMKISSSNRKQYVNLLDKRSLNAVQQDAVNLFTDQTLEYVREVFGEEFWVRKDMLNDAIGYRSASVTDFWTGNTTWSKETQDAVRKLVAAVHPDAYKILVKGEQVVQNFMADARTMIVVKSVVVPALNFMSNIYQLISRGVPLTSIVRGMPRKLGEIDSYAKTRLRQIDAEAELRATDDPIQQRKLQAEIQSITDSHKRLTIWPLIEAGEFSTIADVGMTSEDLELTSGKLGQYIERQVNKLPESVRNAGRYALVTRDTALFQGLQKAVQYGDFIGKAVLFEDLTQRKKLSQSEALGRITEEFVNYDRLPGRFRAYMENMGLLWFYNYKIRISKVALSTIRNNPVHALLAMVLPSPDLFGSIGLPVEDNLFSKLFEGSLDFSIGPEMGLRAPLLNPWFNLIH